MLGIYASSFMTATRTDARPHRADDRRPRAARDFRFWRRHRTDLPR